MCVRFAPEAAALQGDGGMSMHGALAESELIASGHS